MGRLLTGSFRLDECANRNLSGRMGCCNVRNEKAAAPLPLTRAGHHAAQRIVLDYIMMEQRRNCMEADETISNSSDRFV